MPSTSQGRKTPIVSVVLAVAFVASCWLATFWFGHAANASARGTFGDMFGAANAAFSGLAFVGIIYAIFLQRNEVKIAKEDLNTTRMIFNEQLKQLDHQRHEMQKKSFEDTFFKLLLQLGSAIDGASFKSTSGHGSNQTTNIYNGQQALSEIARAVATNCQQVDNKIDPESAREWLKNIGGQGYPAIQLAIEILKYLDESDIDNKTVYIDTLKSSISPSVYFIITLYTMREDKNSYIKELLNRYAFFERVELADELRYIADYYLTSTFKKAASLE